MRDTYTSTPAYSGNYVPLDKRMEDHLPGGPCKKICPETGEVLGTVYPPQLIKHNGAGATAKDIRTVIKLNRSSIARGGRGALAPRDDEETNGDCPIQGTATAGFGYDVSNDVPDAFKEKFGVLSAKAVKQRERREARKEAAERLGGPAAWDPELGEFVLRTRRSLL